MAAAHTLSKLVQQTACRMVLLQLAGVGLIALIALLAYGKVNGFSVLMGGLAYGIPNLAFAWRVFKYAGANQIERFMVAFFIGEMAKLVLSAILFLVIVKYLPVSLLSVLIGFIGAIVSFWIVCFGMFSR